MEIPGDLPEVIFEELLDNIPLSDARRLCGLTPRLRNLCRRHWITRAKNERVGYDRDFEGYEDALDRYIELSGRSGRCYPGSEYFVSIELCQRHALEAGDLDLFYYFARLKRPEASLVGRFYHQLDPDFRASFESERSILRGLAVTGDLETIRRLSALMAMETLPGGTEMDRRAQLAEVLIGAGIGHQESLIEATLSEDPSLDPDFVIMGALEGGHNDLIERYRAPDMTMANALYASEGGHPGALAWIFKHASDWSIARDEYDSTTGGDINAAVVRSFRNPLQTDELLDVILKEVEATDVDPLYLEDVRRHIGIAASEHGRVDLLKEYFQPENLRDYLEIAAESGKLRSLDWLLEERHVTLPQIIEALIQTRKQAPLVKRYADQLLDQLSPKCRELFQRWGAITFLGYQPGPSLADVGPISILYDDIQQGYVTEYHPSVYWRFLDNEGNMEVALVSALKGASKDSIEALANLTQTLRLPSDKITQAGFLAATRLGRLDLMHAYSDPALLEKVKAAQRGVESGREDVLTALMGYGVKLGTLVSLLKNARSPLLPNFERLYHRVVPASCQTELMTLDPVVHQL